MQSVKTTFHAAVKDTAVQQEEGDIHRHKEADSFFAEAMGNMDRKKFSPSLIALKLGHISFSHQREIPERQD